MGDTVVTTLDADLQESGISGTGREKRCGSGDGAEDRKDPCHGI